MPSEDHFPCTISKMFFTKIITRYYIYTLKLNIVKYLHMYKAFFLFALVENLQSLSLSSLNQCFDLFNKHVCLRVCTFFGYMYNSVSIWSRLHVTLGNCRKMSQKTSYYNDSCTCVIWNCRLKYEARSCWLSILTDVSLN